MRKLPALMLTLPLLLLGCKTAPTAQVQAVCPRIPELDQTPAAQVPSFTNRMRDFLAGKLTEQSDYSLTLPSAKLPTIKPERP